MKYYLAARYDRRKELQELAEHLKLHGMEVTSRWLEGNHESKEEQATNVEKAQWAAEDWEDIGRSDTLVFFCDPPETPGAGRGGRNVEFGIALALNKRVFTVGEPENIFHQLGGIQFESSLEFLSAAIYEKTSAAPMQDKAFTTAEIPALN